MVLKIHKKRCSHFKSHRNRRSLCSVQGKSEFEARGAPFPGKPAWETAPAESGLGQVAGQLRPRSRLADGGPTQGRALLGSGAAASLWAWEPRLALWLPSHPSGPWGPRGRGPGHALCG